MIESCDIQHKAIDQSHKSHNAPIWHPTVHISVLNGVLWDMGQVHWGIYEIGLIIGKV